jgi:hypothetical protein
LDDRRVVKVMAEEGPKIAVEKIFKALADISMNEGKKH